ncbi:MAG: DUF4212 domain-containing protein [Verrucomicrobia bacterium]|nr:MAG: DUF4212 domain-containing protein [Verrucomicrobiota bacterium]
MTSKQLPSEAAKSLYWKKTLYWLYGFLGVWFFISFGCGILWVDFLDRFNLPGTNLKLGFWFAQQGSVIGFVIIIAVYAWAMNRLDRELVKGTSAEGLEDT